MLGAGIGVGVGIEFEFEVDVGMALNVVVLEPRGTKRRLDVSVQPSIVAPFQSVPSVKEYLKQYGLADGLWQMSANTTR